MSTREICGHVRELYGVEVSAELSVMNDLKARGLEDILIAVVDGLSGFPDAIEAAYPQALVHTCIVHLIRNSMAYASWKKRKAIAAS